MFSMFSAKTSDVFVSRGVRTWKTTLNQIWPSRINQKFRRRVSMLSKLWVFHILVFSKLHETNRKIVTVCKAFSCVNFTCTFMKLKKKEIVSQYFKQIENESGSNWHSSIVLKSIWTQNVLFCFTVVKFWIMQVADEACAFWASWILHYMFCFHYVHLKRWIWCVIMKVLENSSLPPQAL